MVYLLERNRRHTESGLNITILNSKGRQTLESTGVLSSSNRLTNYTVGATIYADTVAGLQFPSLTSRKEVVVDLGAECQRGKR